MRHAAADCQVAPVLLLPVEDCHKEAGGEGSLSWGSIEHLLIPRNAEGGRLRRCNMSWRFHEWLVEEKPNEY